ncbi:MAG: GDP-mannose 4,6-dehydratase [Alphaproteobacteria bacterium]|nr:GDP-mannose 4,6-dehydratase [Alphaproteobacteria bacterium]
MAKKSAIITGITGQDGGYLAKLLLEKGYKVYGAYRRGSEASFNKLHAHGIYDQVELLEFELLEFTNICRVLQKYQPDEFYNLAAQSFVGTSFEQPIYTTQVDAIGPAYILEAIRSYSPHTKFYQASTSEMFGLVQSVPQSEKTPFYPRSPYGVAKLYAHWLTINYRESYNLHANSGILFNHESPMRGKEFVTRKITDHLAKIFCKITDKPLELGNLHSKRDWGFAGDYVEAMWLMLQQEKADDYVVSTGETYEIIEFVNLAASICGFDLEWSGENETEKAIDKKTGKTLVQVNPKFYRPAEVELLIGDSKKAETQLGWKRKVDFPSLVKMMMENDIAIYQKKQ